MCTVNHSFGFVASSSSSRIYVIIIFIFVFDEELWEKKMMNCLLKAICWSSFSLLSLSYYVISFILNRFYTNYTKVDLYFIFNHQSFIFLVIFINFFFVYVILNFIDFFLALWYKVSFSCEIHGNLGKIAQNTNLYLFYFAKN